MTGRGRSCSPRTPSRSPQSEGSSTAGFTAALHAGESTAYRCSLPLEIERKFLLLDAPGWLSSCRVEEIEQGYLAIEADEVEVRLRRRGERACVTVKRGSGPQRIEEEIEVNMRQFEALWPLTAGRRLQKSRHYVPSEVGEMEVDVCREALNGLITVEVEFVGEDEAAAFVPPD